MAKESKTKKASTSAGRSCAPKRVKKKTRQGNSPFSKVRRGRKAYRGQGR